MKNKNLIPFGSGLVNIKTRTSYNKAHKITITTTCTTLTTTYVLLLPGIEANLLSLSKKQKIDVRL